MDPDAFTASLLKWDLRGGIAPQQVAQPQPQILHQQQAVAVRYSGLEELLGPYGIRCYTTAKIAELGFTVSTLLDMRDEELDEMMNSVSHVFRLDLLVGERYGIKAAVRAERRRLDDERRALLPDETALDALSQEGSDTMRHVAAQQEREPERPKKPSHAPRSRRKREKENPNEDDDGLEYERQREHPFIVTEPGEVARGKKNGLDYLFHLYEQCREFLIQVQRIAKENGDKSPIKVTNQVFRFAKTMGASYINKPKMRHYVHCYALHCLDEETSNALRRAMKERGENVGAWRQACYKPLVNIAARQGWEIDAIFNAHPRLNIWYVPTKLRQLCHLERSNAAATALPPRERFTY